MRIKLIACLILGIALIAGAHATATFASTSTQVDMTFHEVVTLPGEGGQTGCSVAPDGYCGQGEVSPFGQATETIEFGPCPGPHCNLCIITVADGTLLLHEDPYFEGCLGYVGCMLRGYGNPFNFILIDQVLGGTGAYAGASGTLNGSLSGNGASALIQLSGTLILP